MCWAAAAAMQGKDPTRVAVGQIERDCPKEVVGSQGGAINVLKDCSGWLVLCVYVCVCLRGVNNIRGFNNITMPWWSCGIEVLL